MSQAYTISVTLDPDTYRTLEADAAAAGASVADHASRLLGADLDLLAGAPQPVEAPKRKAASGSKR